jgi:hypothetical protein
MTVESSPVKAARGNVFKVLFIIGCEQGTSIGKIAQILGLSYPCVSTVLNGHQKMSRPMDDSWWVCWSGKETMKGFQSELTVGNIG